MKKAYIQTIQLLIIIVIVGCSKTYDDFDPERPNIVGFTLGTTLELPLGSNPVNDFPIPFFVSSISSSERTFVIKVISEETVVTADNYSFDTTVTLPPNERAGTLFFSAVNNSLTDEFEPLVIAFEETEGVISGNRLNILLRSNN